MKNGSGGAVARACCARATAGPEDGGGRQQARGGHAALERRLARLSKAGSAAHSARLRTLLPLLRAALLSVILAVVGLTAGTSTEDIARRAGMKAASVATAMSSRGTAENVSGSIASMPNNCAAGWVRWCIRA